MLNFSREKLLDLYKNMVLIRKYEERIYFLFLEGIMPGTIHQSHGQEASAVGMLYDLQKTDYMTTTHRPAGHALAKGVSLKSMMAEMFAKTSGCCHGYGGAMHVGDMAVGAVPAIAIVGGGVPLGVGIALSCKMRKTDSVCVTFLGDGATNEGAVHESMNGAMIWKLPIIFAVENNLYGASTSIKQTTTIENLAERAKAYNMPAEIVDGNDVIAVNQAAERAIARARSGSGPTFLELKTYRIGGHSRNDTCGYRTKKEEAEWAKRDAIKVFGERLVKEKIASRKELNAIDEQIEQDIDEAVVYAKSEPSPVAEDAFKNVYVQEGLI
ncbi:pyruvate dehydrogenase E1 component subunit alpha [Clostridia bacterium]|nr:pyruvate dehydrogenase E1 component subunit alpha [Clostridia bacterium]